jgi:hypothetical protein
MAINDGPITVNDQGRRRSQNARACHAGEPTDVTLALLAGI